MDNIYKYIYNPGVTRGSRKKEEEKQSPSPSPSPSPPSLLASSLLPSPSPTPNGSTPKRNKRAKGNKSNPTRSLRKRRKKEEEEEEEEAEEEKEEAEEDDGDEWREEEEEGEDEEYEEDEEEGEEEEEDEEEEEEEEYGYRNRRRSKGGRARGGTKASPTKKKKRGNRGRGGNSNNNNNNEEADEKAAAQSPHSVNASGPSRSLSSFLLNQSIGIPITPSTPLLPSERLSHSLHFKNYSVGLTLRIFDDRERIERMKIIPRRDIEGIGGEERRKGPLAIYGSKYGKIAIWSCPSAEEGGRGEGGLLCSHSPHRGKLKDIGYCPFNQSIVSVSEGECKLTNINLPSYSLSHIDTIATSSKDFTCLSTASNSNDSVILIGDEGGNLTHRDLRSPLSSSLSYSLHHKKMSGMATDPFDNNYFTTSANIHRERKGPALCRWDRRVLSTSIPPSPVDALPFKQVIKSLCYSSEGKYIMISSYDETVRIYNNSNYPTPYLPPVPSSPSLPSPSSHCFPLIYEFPHYTKTGIWISALQPSFHPENSDIVLIGNMRGPTLSLHSVRGRREVIGLRDSNIKGIHGLGEISGREEGNQIISCSYAKSFIWNNPMGEGEGTGEEEEEEEEKRRKEEEGEGNKVKEEEKEE